MGNHPKPGTPHNAGVVPSTLPHPHPQANPLPHDLDPPGDDTTDTATNEPLDPDLAPRVPTALAPLVTPASHFAFALSEQMVLHGITWDKLPGLLLSAGYNADGETMLWWKLGGFPRYAWDNAIIALGLVFAVDPVAFVTPAWEQALTEAGTYPRDRTFGQLLNAALLPGEGARLARALTEAGFHTKRQNVSHWRAGTLPANGLPMLPLMAKTIGCPVAHLVPLVATPMGGRPQ